MKRLKQYFLNSYTNNSILEQKKAEYLLYIELVCLPPSIIMFFYSSFIVKSPFSMIAMILSIVGICLTLITLKKCNLEKAVNIGLIFCFSATTVETLFYDLYELNVIGIDRLDRMLIASVLCTMIFSLISPKVYQYVASIILFNVLFFIEFGRIFPNLDFSLINKDTGRVVFYFVIIIGAELLSLIVFKLNLDAVHALEKNKEKIDAQVKERTKELEALNNKMKNLSESRKRLISNISHDLGTPMTSIQGYVKAMIDGVIPHDDTKYLQLVYDKSVYLNRLINDLFQLSKLEEEQITYKKEHVVIVEFITDLYNRFEIEIQQKKIDFKLVVDHFLDRNAMVFIDRYRIEQVIANLVYNAVKFTNSDGGSLVLRLTVGVRGPKDIYNENNEAASAIVDDEQKWVKVELIDNGRGIEPKDLSYIFERYYKGFQSNKEHVNTAGLGLSIAKEIIEFHGGVIKVESKLFEGSNFYFLLPISAIH